MRALIQLASRVDRLETVPGSPVAALKETNSIAQPDGAFYIQLAAGKILFSAKSTIQSRSVDNLGGRHSRALGQVVDHD